MSATALARFNAYYAHQFDARPVATLVIANGTLTSLADVFAQNLSKYLEGHNRPYDWTRTGRFALFGMSMGPPIGAWLRLLDRAFPFPATGSALPATIKRVLADQVVFAPIGLATFTGVMGVMEGKSKPELKQKFDDVYWKALMTNWKVWPAIQAINFGLVPLPYRLPFQQTCGIAWSAYLSLLNAKQDAKALDIIDHRVDAVEDRVHHFVEGDAK